MKQGRANSEARESKQSSKGEQTVKQGRANSEVSKKCSPCAPFHFIVSIFPSFFLFTEKSYPLGDVNEF